MSLNHLHSSLSHLGDDSWDVHYLLFLKLLKNVVNGNIRTSTTNPSTIIIYVVYLLSVHISTDTAYLQCTSIGPLEGLC